MIKRSIRVKYLRMPSKVLRQINRLARPAFLLFGLLSATVGLGCTDFEIPPYLYMFGQETRLAFQSKCREAPVVAYLDGEEVVPLVSTTLSGVLHFNLPIRCGEDFTYWIGETMRTITARPCSNERPSKFGFATDFHAERGRGMQEKFFSALAHAIAEKRPDYFLSGGDLVENDDDWPAFFRGFGPALSGIPFITTLGNHDFGSRWERYFNQPADEHFFKVDIPGVRIVVINSNFSKDPKLVTAQKTLVKNWLSKRDIWKIVLVHHSPISGSKMKNGRAKPPKEDSRLMLEHFVPIFEAAKVDVVLSGDNHIFQVAKVNGVHYLSGGPAGGATKRLEDYVAHSSHVPYLGAPLLLSEPTLTWVTATPTELDLSVHQYVGTEIFHLNLKRGGVEKKCSTAVAN